MMEEFLTGRSIADETQFGHETTPFIAAARYSSISKFNLVDIRERIDLLCYEDRRNLGKTAN